jgi:hypothetical protein
MGQVLYFTWGTNPWARTHHACFLYAIFKIGLVVELFVHCAKDLSDTFYLPVCIEVHIPPMCAAPTTAHCVDKFWFGKL